MRTERHLALVWVLAEWHLVVAVVAVVAVDCYFASWKNKIVGL